MPLKSNQAALDGKMSWELYKTNSGTNQTKQKDSLNFRFLPSTNTYNQLYWTQFSLAANTNQAVDFYSFTNLAGESVTATKIIAVILNATGNGGSIKVEPGDTNPLTWPFAGTTPSVELSCNTDGCSIVLQAGTHSNMNATVRTWKVSNTGNANATVTLAAFVGTA